MKKTIWSALDHQVWRTHSAWPQFHRLLVALSGGVDSVVALSVLRRLSGVARFQVTACHVHHGPGPSESWRNEALSHCRQLCEQLQVQFVSRGPSVTSLKTEADMRSFRYAELLRVCAEQNCDYLVTAHHADDLLETRMLRLLRGTGPEGLEAMREFDHHRKIWRPLLGVSHWQVLEYAHENQLKFINDPSNLSLDPMRNWLRHEIFPLLEARQSGIVDNLGRSLQLLVESLATSERYELFRFEDGALGYEVFLYRNLSSREQRQVLAKMLLELGIRDYSLGQIKEVQKRLDNPQKINNFNLKNALWNIDAKHVRVKLKV